MGGDGPNHTWSGTMTACENVYRIFLLKINLQMLRWNTHKGQKGHRRESMLVLVGLESSLEPPCLLPCFAHSSIALEELQGSLVALLLRASRMVL